MDTAVRIGAGWVRCAMVLGLVGVLFGGAAPALARTSGAAVPLASQPELVAGGVGNQTDPHISGDLVTWTEASGGQSRIGFADLASGTTGYIPNGGNRDSLADVEGDRIVFRRTYTDGTSTARSILVFDVTAPGAGAQELAPASGARRAFPAIGGTTVAFMQFTGSSSIATEVCVADAADLTAPAVCVTDDVVLSNRDPAVSPDGSTVTWAKCTLSGTDCDIYVVRRTAGGWGTPVQLTDSTGQDLLPATDGEIVTYVSNAGGGYDIWWEDVDGTDEHQLVLTDVPGSIETNPDISRGAISFERELPGSTNADLYLYDLGSGAFNQLRTTPDVDETLHAMSRSETDELRVVWASPDGITVGENDIHALWADLGTPTSPVYETCLRYDPTKAHRSGSTAPLKVQLCDSSAANLSSPDVVLTATGLVKLDGSATTALADSPGDANPDSMFRYDPDLAGYVFNLSTKGLSQGTWELRFTVDGSPTIHALPFDVR